MKGDHAEPATGKPAPGLSVAAPPLTVSLVEDDEPVRSLWWKYLGRARDFICLRSTLGSNTVLPVNTTRSIFTLGPS